MWGKIKHNSSRLFMVTVLLMIGCAMTVWAAMRLATVSDVYWDEDNRTMAVWEEVEEANRYQVYLYRDDSKVAEIKTKKLKYNFKNKMMQEGEYTFRVRALAKGRSYSDSYWSEYSDSSYISADYVEFLENGGKIDTQNSGPGAVTAGAWMQDSVGWWYRNADGSFPVNTWFQAGADGSWYFANEQGYMMTGWLTDANGVRYYCNESGAMVTGSQTIDGVSYEFDQSGALLVN